MELESSSKYVTLQYLRDGRKLMLECKEILKKRVEDEFFFRQAGPDEAAIKGKLNEIIASVDKQIAFENKCDFKMSGCTFTLLLFYTSTFYVTNVGAAHCLYTSAREAKHGPSSQGGVSSVVGSDMFKMSTISGGSGLTGKSATFATTNPMKAATFLYKAASELMDDIYGERAFGANLKNTRNHQIEIITTEHSVCNYEELLRLSQTGGIVCKDRKKTDLPYYARPFKLYQGPTAAATTGIPSINWPALRVSRYALSLIHTTLLGL